MQLRSKEQGFFPVHRDVVWPTSSAQISWARRIRSLIVLAFRLRPTTARLTRSSRDFVSRLAAFVAAFEWPCGGAFNVSRHLRALLGAATMRAVRVPATPCEVGHRKGRCQVSASAASGPNS